MLTLKGYEIQQDIYRSRQTRVSRGVRLKDGAPVVLKYPVMDYPSLRDIARIKNEYDILKELGEEGVEGVLSVCALERLGHRTVLVSEDFEGIQLKAHFAASAVGLEELLRIAADIARALAEVHRHNVIHKDINPRNILINPRTGQVRVIDFGISTRLSREVQEVRSPDRLDGTLAYMSPEQTGRVNRALDYRTDMYSFGATLYELVSGAPPFTATNAMELLHAHIASAPPSLAAYGVPEALSDIIEKLMAKTPEERYQSALGAAADLEECARQLRETGAIAPFSLGRQDISHEFEIPQRLYGREREALTLLDTFERVSKGSAALLLVSGYSGIGKSSLIHEVEGPIVKRRGYFAAGKYDQYNRDVPYSALSKAFNGLIHQFLKEPSDQIEALKEAIRRAVGANGQVIIEVIPALELLLGPQPPATSLPPGEAQGRFNFVFEDFLGALATGQHPLVLFLDDLQWADTPSLKLLELLVTDPRIKHLLVIAAYRDNEVDASHASMITLSEIKKAGTLVREIHLEPLTLGNVMDLLADALRRPREETRPLAELLRKKTGGNPFFLVQLLGSLHVDGLLRQDESTGAWGWDIATIHKVGITDNVIELMTSKLQRFPAATQDVLKLAACIGSTFDLGVLSIVREASAREAAALLWPAVREGLVVPLSESYQIFQDDGAEGDAGESAAAVRELISDMLAAGGRDEQPHIAYRFLHDRVQQATYALIPEAQRKVEHLKIGRLLLASMGAGDDPKGPDLFDVVAHLNVGRELLASEEERIKLAELNARAGKKAWAAMALTAANYHFATALGLLPQGRWSSHYELTLDLYREHAECEYLLGAFDRADELLTESIAHAKTRADKGRAYETRMRLSMTHGARDTKEKGVAAGLEALRLFGYDFGETDEERAARAAEEGLEIAAKLAARSMRELEEMPRLTDPETLLVMNLAVALFGAAYQTGEFSLVSLATYLLIRLSLAHGNAEASAFGYMVYGMLLAAATDYERAQEFGELALKLHAKYPDAAMKPKINNIFAHSINPYRNHLETNLPHYRATYESCLEGGDLAYGIWAVFYMFWARLMKGDALQEVYADAEGYMAFLERAGDPTILLSMKILRQVVQCLRGLTDGVGSLDSGGFREAETLDRLREAQSQIGVCWHAMLRTMVDLTFERREEAASAALLAEETLGAFMGFFSSMTHAFYSSLALVAAYPDAGAEQKARYLELIERGSAKMKRVAESCPENYLHGYHLIEAERARMSGEHAKAAELYDLSIQGAQRGRFLNHEALALELAAKHYLAAGRRRLAQVYMSDACLAYARWGAAAKAEQLTAKHAELLAPESVTEREVSGLGTTTETTSTITGSLQALDLATVMSASQAVSEEIVLSKLLEKLMRTVLQHAGAQRGYLLLEREGELLIEASATMEGRGIITLQSTPVADVDDISQAIVQYVRRTRERVVLADAAKDAMFASDGYVARRQPRSLLCMPVTSQGKLIGILYLENNLTEGAFTPLRMEILRVLSSQAAISIENSRLYGHLEEKVKERTAELREAQAKLIRFERESTERRMAGGFAHEVRNALAGARLVIEKVMGGAAEDGEEGIVGSTMADLNVIYEAIEQRLSEDEMDVVLQPIARIVENQRNVEKALKFVFDASNRALNITKRIMDYSMLEEKKSSSGMVELDRVIEGAVSVIEEEMKGQGIAVTASARDLNVLADSVQCYSILQNLLNNARDAILEKGTASEPGAIHLDAEVVDDKLALRVRDNGVGIKKEDLGRIFDAFYSTKPSTGTGLGLATVKKIVDVNGGTIQVESEWKKGTTFTVLLPISGILAQGTKKSVFPSPARDTSRGNPTETSAHSEGLSGS